MNQVKQIGNGSLRLPLKGKRHFTIWGGPYMNRPDNMFGVKMAKEIRNPNSNPALFLDVPTPDFSTPPVPLLNTQLTALVYEILDGTPVYVGCMAGRGRTGLMLSILAKAFGIANPVEYVRKNYYQHAVETQGQYAFVAWYNPPPEVVEALKKARRWTSLQYWFKTNLTRPA